MSKKVILAVLAVCLLSAVAAAQQPYASKKRIAIGVAVYSFGSALDVASSWNQRELNPLARTRDGMFSPAKGIALKAGFLGLTFIQQKRHPKLVFWTRIVSGIGFGLVAARNWSIASRR